MDSVIFRYHSKYYFLIIGISVSAALSVVGLFAWYLFASGNYLVFGYLMTLIMVIILLLCLLIMGKIPVLKKVVVDMNRIVFEYLRNEVESIEWNSVISISCRFVHETGYVYEFAANSGKKYSLRCHGSRKQELDNLIENLGFFEKLHSMNLGVFILGYDRWVKIGHQYIYTSWLDKYSNGRIKNEHNI